MASGALLRGGNGDGHHQEQQWRGEGEKRSKGRQKAEVAEYWPERRSHLRRMNSHGAEPQRRRRRRWNRAGLAVTFLFRRFVGSSRRGGRGLFQKAPFWRESANGDARKERSADDQNSADGGGGGGAGPAVAIAPALAPDDHPRGHRRPIRQKEERLDERRGKADEYRRCYPLTIGKV